MSLVKAGKAMYGDLYHMSGSAPFGIPDIQHLKHADVVIDHDGKGQRFHVCTCLTCDRNYLYSMVLFVQDECDLCYKKGMFSESKHWGPKKDVK